MTPDPDVRMCTYLADGLKATSIQVLAIQTVKIDADEAHDTTHTHCTVDMRLRQLDDPENDRNVSDLLLGTIKRKLSYSL